MVEGKKDDHFVDGFDEVEIVHIVKAYLAVAEDIGESYHILQPFQMLFSHLVLEQTQ
jgi:hypothetical protein